MSSDNSLGVFEEQVMLAVLHARDEAYGMNVRREIETRTDDSLVRAVSVGGTRRPLMLRRSRGHVPASTRLPVPAAKLLVPDAVEQASPTAAVSSAGLRFITTPAPTTAQTGPARAVIWCPRLAGSTPIARPTRLIAS